MNHSEIIKNRISEIRKLMAQEAVTYYLVDTNDPHLSEYISDYYKEREYLSGFTGSNGLLLIGLAECYLWTDGRYFVQAEKELEGTDIILMKMGQKDVPTVLEFIEENFTCFDKLAFNGALISTKFGNDINAIITEKEARFDRDNDFCRKIWTDRPELSFSNIFLLDESVSGKSYKDKLEMLREKLKKLKANSVFISKLDDIMWLFNIRGRDIACNPVAYSYAFVSLDKVIIYLSLDAVNDELLKYFEDNDVIVKNYDSINGIFLEINADDNILLDSNATNYSIFRGFSNVCNIVDKPNPIEYFKAVKNETEIRNSINCYIDDSVVVTRFIKYIKENVGKKEITEIDAANILDDMRSKIAGFIELSFPTISAYGPNAAMMHYEACEDTCALLKEEGIYLVDSGASYMNGTTDVTRSIVLGPITDEMKKHFTLATIGMLRLMNAVFLKGATGRNLDIIARQPLWENAIDYKCGTGHGVGYILNVHEGPQSIRTKQRAGENEVAFEAGMIVSDEPGVYISGSHGIRCENILLCMDFMSNDDGDFLTFMPLTLVPIDLEGIDVKYMTSKDIMLLNNYHKIVYDKLVPLMNEEEENWLKNATRAI